MFPFIRSSFISRNVQRFGNIWPHDGHIIREPSNRFEELSKEDEHPITLHRKPHKRPPHQNQQNSRPKCRCSPPFLSSGEKSEGSLRAEEEGDADEEENVAHGKEGAIKKEDEAEEEEEAAACAECDADFLTI